MSEKKLKNQNNEKKWKNKLPFCVWAPTFDLQLAHGKEGKGSTILMKETRGQQC